MRLLGVDTSSTYASVAVVEDRRLISDHSHVPAAAMATRAGRWSNNHAAVLVPLVESALATAAITVRDISAFAVAIGPGSFTGLRIGLATVQGLSYGSGAPVAGISTLHAIAARVSDFNGIVCAILDARKNEVYAAIFRRSVQSLERLTDDGVLPCDELGRLLGRVDGGEPILLTGEGTATYGERLLVALGNRASIGPEAARPTVAAAVAVLGAAHFAGAATFSQASLAPRYVRPAGPEPRARKLA
jgi:tRNA threonylcarbamoyladenosine biosynthesis protein TsaB